MTAAGGGGSSAAARRSRRRRRRIGRALVSLGYLCAVVAGGLALRAVLDDGDGANASSVPPEPALPRPRSQPVGQNPLVLTGPLPTASAGGDGMVSLSFETRSGVLALAVPGASLRPRTNAAPSIVAPRQVAFAEARDGVGGVRVVDPDDLPGDYGMLLASTGGSISVGRVGGVRFFGENGTNFLPLVGPLAALNEALAALRFDPGPGGGTLAIVVTDYGHGELAQARAGSARLEVAG